MTYPTKLPKIKYWYHATSIENARSIVRDGKIKASMFGTYFANTLGYAQGFQRLKTKGHGQDFNDFAVFKIPKSRLPNLQLGTDHSPSFFPEDLVTAVIFQDIEVTEQDCQCFEITSVV